MIILSRWVTAYKYPLVMMRKIITVVVALTLSLSAYSQKDREHLAFLGIPLNGPLNEYVDKLCAEKGMQKKDYNITGTGEPYCSMSGSFWKFDNCDITIYADTNNNVQKAIVGITDVSIYKYKLQLEDLIDDYYLKYGSPSIKYDGDTRILVWGNKGGRIEYRRLVIPGILNSLRIDYIDCDMEEMNRQKVKELDGL